MATNTKKIKTRVTNKHDSEANWNLATNFIPLAGETIIYDADDNHSEPRVKIGDGKTVVSELDFITKGLEETVQEVQEGLNKLICSGTNDPDVSSESKFYFKYSI
jgi:hypothetical protein